MADVASTGLPAETYDLCIESLADEHLPDLRPLYQEAARVSRPAGHDPELRPPAERSRQGGPGLRVGAAGDGRGARGRGLDAEKPKWEGYRGLPISFSMVWRRLG
ncbi:MAG: hypothetical protein ACREJS_16565 [Candidatus Rokuibacteriota bacterium]